MSKEPSIWLRSRMFNIYIFTPAMHLFLAIFHWRRGQYLRALFFGSYFLFFVSAYPRFAQLVWRSLKGEW